MTKYSTKGAAEIVRQNLETHRTAQCSRETYWLDGWHAVEGMWPGGVPRSGD